MMTVTFVVQVLTDVPCSIASSQEVAEVKQE